MDVRVHATARLVGVTALLTGALVLSAVAAFGEIAGRDADRSGAERASRAIDELRTLATDDFVAGQLTSHRRMEAAARAAVVEHGMRTIDVAVVGSPARASRSSTVRVVAGQSDVDDAPRLGLMAAGTPAARPAPQQVFESAALITTPLGHEVRIATSFLPGGSNGRAGRLQPLPVLGALTGFLGVPYVVLARLGSRRARRRLRERDDEIARIKSAALNERRRIAAAVHDGALQDLVGLSLGLANAARTSSPIDRPMLREMSGVTRRTAQSLRSVLANVYAADLPEDGWTAGLESVVGDLRSVGVDVTIDVDDVELCPEQEASLLRVAREALRNVYKHAAASSVTVRFRSGPDGDQLLIVDDGVGFDLRVATSARDARSPRPAPAQGRGDRGRCGPAHRQRTRSRHDRAPRLPSAGGMIRILVVDDHPLVRAGLQEWLNAADDMEVIGVAADGREAIDCVEAMRPDVVLMDLSMPVLDGVQATIEIVSRWPEVRVIALTTTPDPHRVNVVLAAGAAGYMLKDVDPAVLVANIRAATLGGLALSPQIAAQYFHRTSTSHASDQSALTPRELEVLAMIAEGRSNKQIARALGISDKTVKAHCGHIFERLGVSDRTQAAIWALQHSVAGERSLDPA